ncbi:hypothetical protein [Daejeonella sp.]|jgi:hypothetical protein|uniref:hypothetical protein n=1 Tax=Daejeonella sp. TaxID=2805397 RepID=UPI0037C11BE6
MKNLKLILITIVLFVAGKQLHAQEEFIQGQDVAINNFMIKENLLKNNKIAIIATDSLDRPIESLSGTFQFSINGFGQELQFNNGVAVLSQAINKSTFIYLRHENQSGTHGKLYYVYQKGDSINPIKISWWILVIIPLILILLAALFRKFIVVAVIILIGLFYYNSSQGLKLPTFFDTIFDGLRNMI